MDTKKFITPFKKFTVEIKEYLTAGDEFEIQKVVYDVTEIKDGVITGLKKSQGDVMFEMEKKLMEKAVVNINGVGENIFKLLMEMPSADYGSVKKEIENIRKYEEIKKN